jgi:hypothetical protein
MLARGDDPPARTRQSPLPVILAGTVLNSWSRGATPHAPRGARGSQLFPLVSLVVAVTLIPRVTPRILSGGN